jgi:hypothetical protein
LVFLRDDWDAIPCYLDRIWTGSSVFGP